MAGRSVLVTGGAGFIGSQIAQVLVERGDHVRILDNFSTGRREALGGAMRKVEFQEGDIRNAIACRNACRGVDTVFHLAAYISAPGSVKDPVTADAVNIGGTLNMLMAARETSVRRLVFSSSAAVYGNSVHVPVQEDALPRPETPYGLEKLYGEHMGRMFHSIHGLETVALRYFNVYGAGQNPNSEYAAVIPRFLTALITKQRPTIFGDGEQTRDFLSVKDVVQANILSADVPDIAGGVFNIAGGTEVSLNKLLAIIQSVVGGKVLKPIYSDTRQGDIRRSVADISASQSILGFAPSVGLEIGLTETVEYLRGLLEPSRK